MKKKITLGAKLVTSVGILLAQVLFLTIVALTSIGSLSEQLHRAQTVTTAKAVMLGQLRASMSEMSAMLKGAVLSFAISDLPQFEWHKQRFERAAAISKKALSDLQPLFDQQSAEKLRLALDGNHVAMMQHYDDVVQLCAQQKASDAIQLLQKRVVPEIDSVERNAADLIALDAERNRTDTALADASSSRSRSIAWGMVLLSLVVGTGVLTVVLRINAPLRRLISHMEVLQNGDFSRRLDLPPGDEFGRLAGSLNTMADKLTALIGQVQRSGIQVNSSAREVAAMTQQQKATANAVAATTTEIGATSTEIYATSRELVSNVIALTTGAESTAIAAGGSRTSLTRMETTIQHLLEASNGISSKLTALSEKAGNISAVVTTIAKVADQTNLLSLNAAIEAEKAGEQGRGFSVVATEIRRLADQTAIATHDIEQIVKNMQSAVSAGVMSVDKFSAEVRESVGVVTQVSGHLNQIINEVQALTPNIETLKDGMQAQSVGAQQISEALAQLSQSTQETVETLSQSNTTVEQLNEAARDLHTGVSRFVLQS